MKIIRSSLSWTIFIFICAAIFRLTNLDLIEFKLDEARDVYEMERFYSCHPERSEGFLDLFQNESGDSSASPQNDMCGFRIIQRGTIQSTGVYNPPLWYYFLAVISLPSRDPQYLSFMIALINSLAVAGFYWVVRKFYGFTTVIPSKDGIQLTTSRSELDSGLRRNDKREWFGVAEIAGLLTAFSPWMILMSRKIWAPDMIFPLVVVWFYFLHVIARNVVIEQSSAVEKEIATVRSVDMSVPRNDGGVKWAWLGLVLTLMLLIQLHASGIFLAVATVVVLAVSVIARRVATKQSSSELDPAQIATGRSIDPRNDKVINFKFAFLGLILGLIPLLPYIGYQLTNACPDCQAFSTYQQGEAVSATPIFDPNAFLRPFQFINGSSWNGVLGEEGMRDFTEQYPFIKIFNFLFLLEFGLFVVGIFYLSSLRMQGSNYPSSRSELDSRLRGNDGKGRYMWLLLLLGITSLLVFFTKTPGHLYYFLIVSPISILIYALGITHRGVSLWIPPHWKWGPFVGMTVVVINIIFTFSFYKFLGEVKVVKGDYGATYGVVRELAEEKLAQFKDRPDYGLVRAEFFVNMFNHLAN